MNTCLSVLLFVCLLNLCLDICMDFECVKVSLIIQIILVGCRVG